MVCSLVFALLAGGVPSADPVARYDAFMKAHPSFVATVEASSNGKVMGTGVAAVNRPKWMRFDFKGSGMDYLMSSTELGYVELDQAEKIYDEHEASGGLRLFNSRISAAAGLFPHYLLPPTVMALFGKKPATITPVAGGDELGLVIANPMGSTELKLVVDPEGKPIRFSIRGQSGLHAWRLISFKPGSTSLSAYRVEPPLGYVPYALPDLPFPLEIGDEAPLVGWKKGGKPIDLGEPQRGKPRLLAVLGTDCPASKAVRPTLAGLAKSLPVLIIAPGEIVDPSGTLMKKLSPPGTPMFYLVGADQKVTNLWFGFDAAKASAWATEVLKAAKAK